MLFALIGLAGIIGTLVAVILVVHWVRLDRETQQIAKTQREIAKTRRQIEEAQRLLMRLERDWLEPPHDDL